MQITQQPINATLYFQKSVPDIYITKTSSTTEVLFELKENGTSILTETYKYDATNKIQIRDIYKICEKYLVDGVQYKTFQCIITEDTTVDFTFSVLKCEAEIAASAAPWCAANFLTRSYKTKRTLPECNELLSYLQLSAHGVITPRYEITYYSNNTLTTTTGTLTAISSVNDPTVININTSSNSIRTLAAIDANVEILEYKIWLTGTDITTNKYSFLVDNNAYRNKQFFTFENCFGVPETVFFTGVSEKSTSNEFTYGNIQNRIRLTEQNFTVENNCFTGYLTDREMEWLNDFIISPNIMFHNKNSNLLQNIVLSSIDKTESTANELKAFSFGYKQTQNNNLQFENAMKGIFDYTFNNTFN